MRILRNTTDRSTHLSAAGVSLWLDDLSRRQLLSGALEDMIATKNVRGVTTSPMSFHNAFQDDPAYHQRIKQLADRGVTVDGIVRELLTDDVRDATDLLSEVYHRSRGLDGRVSISIDPRLAHDTGAIVEQASELFTIIRRDNILIEIPASPAGIAAITEVIAMGISVNVALIFSPERYTDVMEAYISGLERAKARGRDLSQIRSVASFPITLIDAEIDRRLIAIGSPAARALLGQAGIANAALAYQAYEQTFAGRRWASLAALNAHKQRPLWATHPVKPDVIDSLYLETLLTPGTVTSASPDAINAAAEHRCMNSKAVPWSESRGAEVFGDLDIIGINLGDAFTALESTSLMQYEHAWTELLHVVHAPLPAGQR